MTRQADLSPAQATYLDARRHLKELRAVREVLLPDADDPEVLSEIVAVDSQIRSAMVELGTESSQVAKAPAGEQS